MLVRGQVRNPSGRLLASGDGWLNRMLGLLPGARAETAFAVGRGQLKLLSGSAPASSWSPDADLDLSPQAQLLLARVYATDPLFRSASEQAFAISQKVSAQNMSRTRVTPSPSITSRPSASLRFSR